MQDQYNDIKTEQARDQHISVLASTWTPRKERPQLLAGSKPPECAFGKNFAMMMSDEGEGSSSWPTPIMLDKSMVKEVLAELLGEMPGLMG